MRNIKLIIEYDGTKYNGWQRLGNTDNTIQAKIEGVLSKMTGENVEIIGSGRTDAGVHAYGQIANFKTHSTLSSYEIRDYCNQYLPQDIVIKEAVEVEERFHARYNATNKKYLYRIWTGRVPTAFHRKYTYYIPQRLNIEDMRKAASYLIGEHDFLAFSSVKSKKKSTVREIYAIDIHREDSELTMMFHGNGFLHNMVRIMVGTLIEVGLGKMKAEEIPAVMEGRIRAQAGTTAPGQGLFLYEVHYGE